MNKYRVGNAHISITSQQNAIDEIENAVKKGINAHMCVCDFRSVRYASSHPDYNAILETSFLNTPDGMPLIWMARLWGIGKVHRTMGPELFVKMIKKSTNGLKHFLLGDTDETLDKIRSEFTEKYNSLIVGTYSPPFIDLTEYDYLSIAKMVNDSGADLVWISMTAPKQDYFTIKLEPLLDNKVIIGVGAAFRYSLGLYKIPNGFAQKVGLTGFFMRKKSWKQFVWYVKHSFILINFSAQIIFRRITGKKYYE
jgi:N-acetylglucosaminyldiphosphoundecaprenol N-acetyl-beta-D-mannosaminyltransferase